MGRANKGGRKSSTKAAPTAPATSSAVHSGTTSSNGAGPSKPDIPSLIDKAHTLLAQSNFELAIKFLHRALEWEPDNLEAREVLGVAELEGGDEEAGREHLLHLFPPHTPAPPPHPSPYLYLAQTAADPHEALGYYSAAAAMIENQLKASAMTSTVSGGETSDGEDVQEIRGMGVRSLVAMIEIWMSDLCMEPQAEENCEALITRAIGVAPNDVEVQLTLASIRMSQSRFEEAKEVVKGVYGRIGDLDAFDPTLPPLPTRLLLARQLLEHNQHLSALDIVSVAREEDSLEVESAYLEGWAWYLRGKALAENTPTENAMEWKADQAAAKRRSEEARKGLLQAAGQHVPDEAGDNDNKVVEEDDGKGPEDLSSQECLSEGMRALMECAALYEEQEYPDEGIGSHTAELLDEMKGMGVVPNLVEADDEDGEGEGWEDVEMQ